MRSQVGLTLDSDDIEAIARRVAELVGPLAGFVDARSVAVALQVERDWVYAHARELGVLRLGAGPKARLRFDLAEVRQRMGALAAEGDDPPREERLRRRPQRSAELSDVKLIQGRSNR